MATTTEMPKMYREFQTRGAILTEKERAVNTRRHYVNDLRAQLQRAREDLQQRDEHIESELQRFYQKKRQQDEKVQVKENRNRSQQERLSRLHEQGRQFASEITNTQERIHEVILSTERRQHDAELLASLKDKITAMKLKFEEEDAAVMKLESHVARVESSVMKRHSVLSEKVPELNLPTLTDFRPEFDGCGGESIVLVEG